MLWVKRDGEMEVFSTYIFIQRSKLKKPKSPGNKLSKGLGINRKKTSKYDIESNIQRSKRVQ